jgi:hypothetical protein
MPLEQHEPRDQIPQIVQEQHRVLASLIEELEAVGWYQTRAANCKDDEARAILEHNRDEEIEHAAMLLEWLRRYFPGFEDELRTYLFTDKPITEVEEDED